MFGIFNNSENRAPPPRKTKKLNMWHEQELIHDQCEDITTVNDTDANKRFKAPLTLNCQAQMTTNVDTFKLKFKFFNNDSNNEIFNWGRSHFHILNV